MKRRDFIRTAGVFTGSGVFLAACGTRGEGMDDGTPADGTDPIFRISLAEWSLHRAIGSGDLDPLDFPITARRDYGIEAVEYVNGLFSDRRTDMPYLTQLKERADGEGVRSLLIMCDGEGRIGDPDEAVRVQTVDNHRRWLDAAAFLGCHSIRVNADAGGIGPRDQQAARAADGLRRLCEVADPIGLNVIVENHGGLSSDGSWLADVMRRTDHPRVGTLPDFGNFRVSGEVMYDRYRGVQELMPYAKAVSAKSHAFDEHGDETETDFNRMMRLVLDAGYRGYVGIEYEGSMVDEAYGIRATKALLQRVRTELTPEYS